MLQARIQQHFIDSADLAYQSAAALAAPMAAAVQALLACVTGGGKLLIAAQGADAALAPYFAALCVEGFERGRPPLAALALASERDCSRQVQALGLAGDVLMVLSSAAVSTALSEAIAAAHERDMGVLALTGRSSGALENLLRETDVWVQVPHERAARVREIHTLVLHSLCDGVDAQLLGDQEM